MPISIYGAFRTDTTLSDFLATTGSFGGIFRINAYSQLTFDGGADPAIVDGDSVVNESPNDPTQTLAGDFIFWDFTMAVTDGFDIYEIGVMDYDLSGGGFANSFSSEQGYFLAFVGDIPPLDTPLQIIGITDNGSSIQVDTLVPCFARGTMIETPGGPCAVEDLRVGDAVVTLDRGAQRLRWVGSRTLGSRELALFPHLRAVRIAADALGDDVPVRDLIVSPQHRVLLRSTIVQRMFGCEEILVAAKKLLGLPGISVDEDAREVTYFHLLLDRHEILLADGAPTESLFTGPQALRSVGPEARAEIRQLFPALGTPAHAPVLARTTPRKGPRIRRMLARHQANGKQLVQPLRAGAS